MSQVTLCILNKRVLSIRENARLQGFPDYYKFFGPQAKVIKSIVLHHFYFYNFWALKSTNILVSWNRLIMEILIQFFRYMQIGNVVVVPMPIFVPVRIGQVLDVVAHQAGRPKTITSFQTHSTPLRWMIMLNLQKRSNLLRPKFIQFGYEHLVTHFLSMQVHTTNSNPRRICYLERESRLSRWPLLGEMDPPQCIDGFHIFQVLFCLTIYAIRLLLVTTVFLSWNTINA